MRQKIYWGFIELCFILGITILTVVVVVKYPASQAGHTQEQTRSEPAPKPSPTVDYQKTVVEDLGGSLGTYEYRFEDGVRCYTVFKGYGVAISCLQVK